MKREHVETAKNREDFEHVIILVHNVMKRQKEVGEVCVCKDKAKNQYWMPMITGPSGSTALKKKASNSCIGSQTFPKIIAYEHN